MIKEYLCDLDTLEFDGEEATVAGCEDLFLFNGGVRGGGQLEGGAHHGLVILAGPACCGVEDVRDRAVGI